MIGRSGSLAPLQGQRRGMPPLAKNMVGKKMKQHCPFFLIFLPTMFLP
jgi:hypothetical protein